MPPPWNRCTKCGRPVVSGEVSRLGTPPRRGDRLYARSLVRDIKSGTLDGADWWRQVHERGFDQVPPPFDPSHPHDTSRPGD